MANELPFRLLALAVLVPTFGMSFAFRRRAERRGGRRDSSRGRWLSVGLRGIFILFMLPLVAYLIDPSWVEWARVPLPDGLRWAGGLLALLAVPGFYWLLHHLGTNITATQYAREGATLVTTGPYHYVRHPMYSLGVVYLLGLVLLTELWPLAAGSMICYALLLWRTPREEAELVETFGEAYRQYQRETGQYLPRFR